MTINMKLDASCTDCGKQLDLLSQYHFEDMDELLEAANVKGWTMQVLVPNGSEWDFCTSCYKKYVTEQLTATGVTQ
jgi:hypothetical protein